MRSIYYGTVTALTGDGRQAYIGQDTLLTAWLSQVKLNTTADIYVHQDDVCHKLEVGLELEFSLEKDTRRTKGNPFRASHVRAMKSLAHVRRKIFVGRVLGVLILLAAFVGMGAGARVTIEALKAQNALLVAAVALAVFVVSSVLAFGLIRDIRRNGF